MGHQKPIDCRCIFLVKQRRLEGGGGGGKKAKTFFFSGELV